VNGDTSIRPYRTGTNSGTHDVRATASGQPPFAVCFVLAVAVQARRRGLCLMAGVA
jgi:hypothetical protein